MTFEISEIYFHEQIVIDSWLVENVSSKYFIYHSRELLDVVFQFPS